MKRILSFLLAMALMFTVLPFGAKAAKGGKLVALTFDDGPHGSYTEQLLDGLKQRNAKVTFFTLGESANAHLDIIRRAYDEGHEIACHSWDHPDLTGLSDDRVVSQVEDSMAVLDKVCGKDADYLFRAPYGSTNDRVLALINYPLIHWSVDPQDWKYRDTSYVRSHIDKYAFDGAIILLHDIHKTSIPAALGAIDDLQAQGYEFVTVSELYRRRGVELQNHKWHYSCKPTGQDLGPIAKPVISYTTDKKTMEITLTADTDAPIYYTTDGSTPNEQAKRYEGPFTVNYPCNIHAVAAYKLNGCRSDMAVLAPGETPAEKPVISIKDMTMTLSCATQDASIYYTTDGSDPRVNGIVYEGPVKITGGYELRVVSGGGFYKMSPEVRLYCSTRGQLYADMDPDAWYFDPMDRMVAEGLMAGVGDYKIAPRMKLTRGMLVTLLYTYSGDKLEDGWKKTSAFTDVDPDRFYAEPVEWAFRNGVVAGYSAKKFGPNDNVTRQELCTIVSSFLAKRGHALPAGESCEGKFADYAKIAGWALPSVEAMVSAGMVTGDGTNVNPLGNTTRAEAATVLVRMMDYEDSFAKPEPQPTDPAPTESAPTNPTTK